MRPSWFASEKDIGKGKFLAIYKIYLQSVLMYMPYDRIVVGVKKSITAIEWGLIRYEG